MTLLTITTKVTARLMLVLILSSDLGVLLNAAVLSRAAAAVNPAMNDPYPHRQTADPDVSSPASNGIFGLSANAADFVPTSVRTSTRTE